MQIRETRRGGGFCKPTIAKDATKSTVVKCEEYVTGMIYFPQLFTGQNVTFEGSYVDHKDATSIHPTFAVVQDTAAADYSILVNPLNWSPIPAQVMSMAAFKIVSDATETAERSMIVWMKS